MPGDLQISAGPKPRVHVTHLEVMAVVHPILETDGTDSDASEPSPTPGKGDRDDVDDNRVWTTVNRKGCKSRSTSCKKRCQPETLDVELGHVVREAEKCLMPDDHNRINKRVVALKRKPACRQSDGTSEMASKGKGPSTLKKGKGIDPRNWGALSDVGEDLDLDEQRAALESWNLACDIVHLSAVSSDEESDGTHLLKEGKHSCKLAKQGAKFMTNEEARTKLKGLLNQPVKNKCQLRDERCKDAAEKKNLSPVKVMVDKAITLSDKLRKCHHTPKMMEPVEQVDPESYIGLVFKQLDKRK